MPKKELLEYIKRQLHRGISEQEILETLLSAGWQKEAIKEVLSQSLTGSAKQRSPEKPKKRLVLAITGVVIFIGLAWGIYTWYRQYQKGVSETVVVFTLAEAGSATFGDTEVFLTRCITAKEKNIAVGLRDKKTGTGSEQIQILTSGGSFISFAEPFGVLIIRSLKESECQAEFEYRKPSTIPLPIGEEVEIRPGKQWKHNDEYVLVYNIDAFYGNQPSLLSQKYEPPGNPVVSPIKFETPVKIGDDTLIFSLVSQDLANHTARLKIVRQ